MGITAMALALLVLTLVAGCLQWSLLFYSEELYPAAEGGFSHPLRVRLFFRTLTGLTTVGVLAVLLLEFRLVTS